MTFFRCLAVTMIDESSASLSNAHPQQRNLDGGSRRKHEADLAVDSSR